MRKTLVYATFLLWPRPGWARDFPIGLFGVPSDAPLEEISRAGFTVVLPSATDPGPQMDLAKRAAREGLALVGFPGDAAKAHAPAASWPVSGWYLADEPEVNNVPPAEIRRQADELRRWDPKRPAVLVVGEGRAAADYAAALDELWVDWYPVPHLPLETLGREVSVAVSSAAGKPVVAVVQAMDWRDYPQRNPHKPRVGRFPTFRELRFMAYHAVLRGAAGVYFFEFRKRSQPGKTLADYPEHWEAVRRVASELNALRPFFSSEGTMLTVGALEGRRWRHDGRELIVLLNPTQAAVPIPADLFSGGLWTVFEKRVAAAEAFPGRALAPNQVAVLCRR